jgi:1,4-alpha-glucan branching enzyme
VVRLAENPYLPRMWEAGLEVTIDTTVLGEGDPVRKNAAKNGKASITFELPVDAGAESACVCGSFNEWALDATPMKRRKDGSHSVTVQLRPGRHEYRFFIDGARWENDGAADGYVANGLGSDNSVIDV